MLNICISASLFSVLLSVGHFLLIINASCYIFIPFYILFILCISKTVKTNCKTIEVKDFIFTLLFVGILVILSKAVNIKVNLLYLIFLYTVSFISILCFTTNIRFKSLMS